MPSLNRRQALVTLGATGIAATWIAGASGALNQDASAPAAMQSSAGAFSFVHFTDTHIQPELKADKGCQRCFAKINALQPAFAIAGGDLVFDIMETGKDKARQLFTLYEDTRKQIEAPVHHVIGNHDVLGLSPKSTISEADPEYGKKMFEDRIGKRYSSFDHGRWHFILLDSIGIAEGRNYIGQIDPAQMDWLKNDLAAVGKARPVVVATHIPLVSGVLQEVADPWAKRETYLVTNSRDVLQLFEGYNVKLVLQGHTHIREEVIYKGVRYITSGAVSGNWWKGEREGHPEGFGVVTVQGDAIAWRYETYGWKAQG